MAATASENTARYMRQSSYVYQSDCYGKKEDLRKKICERNCIREVCVKYFYGVELMMTN